MNIKVAHIVDTLSGTSIPVEIADKMNTLSGINSHIISIEKSKMLPDIVNEENIIFNGVTNINNVLEYLIDNNYHIVNTHHNVFSKNSRELSSKLKKTKMIVVDNQHGHIHYSRKQKLVNLISLYNSDALTFNSNTTADSYNILERILIGNKPVQTIQLGVDWGILKNYQAKCNNKIRRISIAARLIPRKNHITLLKALVKLNNKKLYLDVIGGGYLSEKLLKETKSLSIQDQVVFHGNVKDRIDVYKIMSNTDLFVLPTLGEGFCLALAEAMAMGLPAIVSDLDVFHEVLGDDGLFVPPKNETKLAEVIQAMIDNPDFAWKIGQKNRERAEEMFTLEKTINGYKAFYAYLIKMKI